MTRKTYFFEGWSWFKFNNLGLTLGTNLKLYTSVAKGVKLKVRQFFVLIPTFAKVTKEKLVGGGVGGGGGFFAFPILNRVKRFKRLCHVIWSIGVLLEKLTPEIGN